ncbi:LysM peptidoglycan-binding domain-containing protein [bacterium]|nr:MAG: LysM peptidoglycan-binding domain-containing protein [bacterium]
MIKTLRKITLGLGFVILPFTGGFAQSADSLQFSDTIEIIPMPVFHFEDRIQAILMEMDARRLPKVEDVLTTNRPELSEDDRISLSRIADIYRLHVLSLEAQVNNDALSAEKYITNGISEMQSMLEENPEVQQNRRFTELYRTIMTEYREFYGVTDSGMEETGEIFAIQTELFNEDDLNFDGEHFAFPKEVTTKRMQVPLPQNKYVNNHLAYLWMKRPEIMETWLQRKEKYFPMMEKIFEEENVPKELMHLAMIESGLNPSARSRAAAVGMWQFIKATGSMYGLEVNWWVDERRDPVKATRAAARHLRDLYAYWKDWHLALANYNVSPRRMKYAINKSGGEKDYWVIYPYLPRETRGYVPSFIATTMIASNPEQFGFKAKYEEEPFEYETVDIVGSYDLSVLAECAGIDVNTIKEYNTALIRWATPPGNAVYPLRLPVGSKETFLANFKEVPQSKQMQIFVHKVQRGESLGKIASKYGVTVRDIYESNDKLGRVIYPGQEIVVPIPMGDQTRILTDRPSNDPDTKTRKSYSVSSSSSSSTATQPANTVSVYYVVKSGDTIGHIAEWFDTSAWKIRTWNNTSNLIRVGQRLKIYVPAAQKSKYAAIDDMSPNQKNNLGSVSGNSSQLASSNVDGFVTYKVKKNDNLYDIANNFGISISDIKKLNNLKRNTIFPGQTLKIKEK